MTCGIIALLRYNSITIKNLDSRLHLLGVSLERETERAVLCAAELTIVDGGQEFSSGSVTVLKSDRKSIKSNDAGSFTAICRESFIRLD